MAEQSCLPAPSEKPCEDWNDLLRELARFPAEPVYHDDLGQPTSETWIFRGHTNSEWNLEPSAERGPYSTYRDEHESAYLRAFRAKAHLYIPSVPLPAPDDDWNWLALMQHLGVPTRLLDFTYSQYVAAYFAVCEDLPKRDAKCAQSKETPRFAEIIALNWTVLEEKLESVYRALPSVPKAGMRPAPPPNYSSKARSPAQFRNLPTEERDSAAGDRRLIEERGYVFPFLPSTENMRLSQQQGLFLVNGARGCSFVESLLRMADSAPPRQGLRRIRIPEAIREEVRRHLFRMNIHELTLFPDGKGLSGFLVQRLRLFNQ